MSMGNLWFFKTIFIVFCAFLYGNMQKNAVLPPKRAGFDAFFLDKEGDPWYNMISLYSLRKRYDLWKKNSADY